MAKYHINPATGRPNKCTAQVQCRYVAADQHFDSKEAARAGYEQQMQGQTVSGSLKKSSSDPASSPAKASTSKKPLFDPKVVEVANQEIQKLSNGAVSIQLAADFMDEDSTELIVAFNAEHEMCIVIEEEDGQKVAYTAFGIDPTRTRWPVSQFVTASRIDDLALENPDYRPGGWQFEPSAQGEKIARLINAVAARPVGAPIAPKAPAEKAPSKATAAAPGTRKPLTVIPGVPPVMTKQEMDDEQGELAEDLHGFTVKSILRTRDIDLAEIEKAEREGDYSVGVKVPSHHEIAISTDLARRELGWPPRKKTGIDEDPLRIAELKKNDAYSKTFGAFHSNGESMVARENYNSAKKEFDKLREERRNSAK